MRYNFFTCWRKVDCVTKKKTKPNSTLVFIKTIMTFSFPLLLYKTTILLSRKKKK